MNTLGVPPGWNFWGSVWASVDVDLNDASGVAVVWAVKRFCAMGVDCQAGGYCWRGQRGGFGQWRPVRRKRTLVLEPSLVGSGMFLDPSFVLEG